MKTFVEKEFKFASAHYLPKSGSPDLEAIHGHTYTVTITVSGPINDQGWIIDYEDLERMWDECVARGEKGLDHRLLNDVLNNPTSECIAAEIARRFCVPLAELGLAVTRVVVTEGLGGKAIVEL